MKKRTLKAGKFQRHYATNGILMYRERKMPIEIPEGTLVTILKARRQSHLCSVRCVVLDAESGQMGLGSGRKAVETCIAVETEYLPKLKIEGAAEKPATKGKGKGSKKSPAAALPVVAAEPNQPEVGAGVGAADIAQPAEQPAPQPVVEAPAPVAEAPAPEAAPAELPAEAAV